MKPMNFVEQMIMAFGELLKEHGYEVEATRDFNNTPFILEVTKPGIMEYPPKRSGRRVPKSLILAEMENKPGMLEVCSDDSDLNSLVEIDLANPNSLEETLAMFKDYFIDYLDKPPKH